MRVFSLLLIGGMCALLPVQRVSASSFDPTDFVNTEAFMTIDDTDGTANLVVKFGDTLAKTITYNRTTTRFEFSDAVAITGNLNVVGTASGQNLYATKSMTGAHLYASQTFGGAGLSNCTGSANKVTWLSSTKQFSCEADEGAGSGISQSGADARYVNQSGDTMTGALQIKNNAGLNASGSILTNTNITVNSDNGAADAVLTFGNATFAQSLQFSHANQRFEFSKGVRVAGSVTAVDALSGTTLVVSGTAGNTFVLDGNSVVYNATNVQFGIGTSSPETTLEVVGTASGRLLHAQDLLESSGSLVVNGTTAFNRVKYTWPATAASTTGATLQVNPANGQMSWTGPIIKRINGNSGAAGPYMTWQNLTANSANNTSTTPAVVMTTTGLGAGTWKFKYTIIYQTAAATTGIAVTVNHTGTTGQFASWMTQAASVATAANGIGATLTQTAAGNAGEIRPESVINTLTFATVGVVTANADVMAIIEGIVVVTVSGDLQLKMATEISTSAVRIMEDSTLELMKIE